eukprot:TRINITY_DN40294_c0_g1_i1.p1 TRINITY_DN40294_c0_g1~~TRINITY_DN40294_c0_g1_i1.p1  ORF type:complete len:784 (+),score=130.11 TRINITY_DN40294_c0_g1_i1:263-2353(+)
MATFQHHGYNRTVFAPWLYRKQLMEFLHEEMARPPAGTEVLLTGNPVIAYERFFDHSIELLMKAEIFVLPIALFIFIWLVGEVRLLVIPPAVLVVSFVMACAAAVPLAKWTTLSPDVPPAMVSVMLAFSLDYSLFLLSRFTENKSLGLDIEENIRVLLRHTGHTIVVSGLLIAIAFFGAIALPEQNLHSAGEVLGITVVACMVVNITLTPALLLLFGECLTSSEGKCAEVVSHLPFTRRRYGNTSNSELVSTGEDAVTPGAEAFGSDQEVFFAAQAGAQHKGWLRLMRWIERRPACAVVVVFILFLPFTWQIPKLRATADIYAALPRDMPSVLALRELHKQFPAGRFDPYTLVLTDTSASRGTASNALLTESGYESMLELCTTLQRDGRVDSMLGPPMLIDQRVTWSKAQLWESLTGPQPYHDIYKTLLQSHVNGSAVLLQVYVDFLPRGEDGAQWVRAVREELKAWQSKHPTFTATLSGGAAIAADTQDTVTGSMPAYLAVCITGIAAVVLLMFRSVMLPLRLAFALLFTLAATFGVAVVVYQTPLLHGFFPWLADYDGLTYEVVPLAVCVAVALGLDYDIFLVSRIVEFRLEGFSDRSSIVLGVASTGGIISGAGAIMAVAFSGLFFSNKLLHQQFALLLVTSVLLDTFVVRTVLVPALMLSAGEWNWWPREMPALKHSWRAMADSDDEDDDDE